MTATINRLGIVTNAPGNYPTSHNAREIKLAQTIRESRNLVDTFKQQLVISNFKSTGAIYTGATGEVLAMDSGLAHYEVYQAAVATPAVIAPYQSTAGLVLKTVGVADALELTCGTTSLSRCARTVGTDKRFYFEITLKVGTIANLTEAFIGWRKAEAYQADPDSYAAVAGFHVGATDDGRISITTSVASVETVVDTTLADMTDGTAVTFRIEVGDTGLCKFLVNGSAPTVDVAGFSFTSGEIVIPFIHINAETADPVVSISNFTCGKY